MTETVIGAPARNYVGGDVADGGVRTRRTRSATRGVRRR